MQELREAVRSIAREMFNVEVEPELTRPDERFGDYSSNLAMQLAAKLQQNPRDVAQQLADGLSSHELIQKVEPAGPGFINITLTDTALKSAVAAATVLPQLNRGREILVEFGDPNPFKKMHIGHLYSYIVGDSICRILESTGAKVQRLSYHGDVGLHVAKAIWGMRQAETDENDSHDVGAYYAAGAKAFSEDPKAAEEIQQINQRIYAGDNPEINRLYQQGKRQSFNEFDRVLNEMNIKTDKRYQESESAAAGIELVRAHIGNVFSESQGAVVYEGEKVGLHTRVFITSNGLPTYETKDLGLARLKNIDYPHAIRSIIITAHEQAEYFKVMLAALSEIDPPLATKTIHVSHGFLSLSTGKMSSRTGEVYDAANLLDDVRAAAGRLYPEATGPTYIGAVKYGFVKHRLGTDIVYDVDESVSLEGNSGPYLQYAHARACSILAKAGGVGVAGNFDFDPAERSLARKISEYPEVIAKATDELMPHHIANYLYELAQSFNRFYEQSRIIGDQRQDLRLELTAAYRDVLKHGLSLLNIAAPEKV